MLLLTFRSWQAPGHLSVLFFSSLYLQGGSAFWLDWRRGRKAKCPTRGVGMLSHQLKPLTKRSHAAASCISARGESLHNAHRGPFASNIMRASSIQRHWRSFAWYLMNVFLIPHNLCDSLTGSQGGPFPNQILPGRGDSRSLCGLSLQDSCIPLGFDVHAAPCGTFPHGSRYTVCKREHGASLFYHGAVGLILPVPTQGDTRLMD